MGSEEKRLKAYPKKKVEVLVLRKFSPMGEGFFEFGREERKSLFKSFPLSNFFDHSTGSNQQGG